MAKDTFSKNDINGYIKLIEDVIQSFGLNPLETRMKQSGQWVIYQNKKPIWIYLTYLPRFKEYHLQISAPIVKVPMQNQGDFCRHLISLNATLIGAAFMEKKGIVYMDTVREVIDLNFEEARKLFTNVISYARYYRSAEAKGYRPWPPFRVRNNTKPGSSSLS